MHDELMNLSAPQTAQDIRVARHSASGEALKPCGRMLFKTFRAWHPIWAMWHLRWKLFRWHCHEIMRRRLDPIIRSYSIISQSVSSASLDLSAVTFCPPQAISASVKSQHWDVALCVLGSMLYQA